MQFVDDAKDFWRFWSIRLAALGTMLLGVITAFPDAALQAWAILPPEFKAFIPQNYLHFVTVAIFMFSILARVVKQQNLQPPEIQDMPAKRGTDAK